MSIDVKKKIQLEIAHVLFIDIVGYSKLSINEQRAAIDELTQAVRTSEQFQNAEAAARLIKIPTGDGMALVFYKSPEEPVECALEISRALKGHPKLQLRMGVHSGPVSGVIDVNGQANLAGAGLNMAQRVMDCGDAGHILVSKRVAGDLGEYEHWRPLLHDLGECDVKHGMRMSVVNLHADEVGNPQPPKKFQALKKHRARVRWAVMTAMLFALAAIVAGTAMFSRNRVSSTFAAPEKSIAVLPFENRSEDKANAYFADGIQDEILTRLSKIADLKVISHTSTQQYQSKPGNLSEIAKQLGVANILEGSVQKAAAQVRVNVQLINAQTDSHLWAETYDRKLTDIFAVESEVAERIAGSLEAKLTGSEKEAIATKPTSNPDAYDAYLHGLAAERRAELSAESIQNSARFYREAVQLDPKFALAWARLSIGESNFYFNAYDRAPQRLAAARQAAETAFKLRPDLGETLLAKGYYQYYGLADYPAARIAFEEARRLLPNSADVLLAISYIDRRQGRWQDALAHQEEATQFDPRNPVVFSETSLTHLWQGKYAEARAMIDRALNLAPDDTELIARKAASYQAEGNLEAANTVLEPLPLQPSDTNIFITQMAQLLYQRRYQPAIAALEKALADPPPLLGQNIGFYYVLLALAQERTGNSQAARATYTEGREKLEKLRQSDGDSKELNEGLAFMYAGLGERASALREVQNLAEQTAKNAVRTNTVQTTLAKIQTQLGETESALASLLHLLGKSGADSFSRTPLTAGLLRLDPIWDPLRGDPRFEKLVAPRAPK
jgi:TolB-like protein/class 3 adenylate cyclase/thioredoxin-like negative regulator of GroEL